MVQSVICELLLFGACLLAVTLSLRAGHYWRGLGLALIGLAALLGAFHYAGMETVKPLHQAASSLSGRVSLLLIAAASLVGPARNALLLALAGVMLWLPAQAALAGNVLALMVIAWKGRSRHWPLAIAGCLLFMAAGLLVGTQGEWLGIPRLDLFHLTLALAVGCWLLAGGPPLRQQAEPRTPMRLEKEG
ncbi:hypothetical protein [Metapseudomonas resinovorans]|uniref:Uncharacterized protein n=1 Tax=Metapseudomonas resinovorans NBRC 106553 TaxID=1245471 RepID=S6AIN1_METRE|nr:hypothetical protein [Pseudomonas resinovorans]BAN48270.1 hypothetical protein PCA10_25380 [Pseudomonas resinovorans NBRC 106553]